jgi:BCD family chlorophyll transporter-like MFS transporter
VQATSAGLAIALGGAIRDGVTTLATHGALGSVMTGASVGYGAVYQIEILLLFVTLAAIGPLVRSGVSAPQSTGYGLAEFPN